VASVAFEHVWKRFGDVAVVKDVDLRIPDGDFVVLVGPSGCGKSTTLRVLAGLERHTEGVIRIGDRDVSDLEPRDRDTAMVFQSYALYPHMTVFENMAFGLRLRKLPEAEINARVNEAAAMLGLGEYLQRKPKALSGGQRQRVAMGRAIVRKPSVYLFDEPLSNLDARMRVQVRGEIAKLHQRQGVTTVYVTHDQVEAMTLAKRMVVMKAGVVQQVGPPLDLYARPANTFVAGFIGSPGMNLIPGRVGAADGVPVVQGEGVSIVVPERLRARLPAGGEPVTVGVRPEHLRVESTGKPRVTLRVDVVEQLGHAVQLVGSAGGEGFTATAPVDVRASPGDAVPLTFDDGALHLFDAAGASLA